MRVNSCIFQDRTVCHANLSAYGSTGYKCFVKAVIVHGECTTTLNIDDTLHGGIHQVQSTTILYDDVDAAENFHINKCQVASTWNV